MAVGRTTALVWMAAVVLVMACGVASQSFMPPPAAADPAPEHDGIAPPEGDNAEALADGDAAAAAAAPAVAEGDGSSPDTTPESAGDDAAAEGAADKEGGEAAPTEGDGDSGVPESADSDTNTGSESQDDAVAQQVVDVDGSVATVECECPPAIEVFVCSKCSFHDTTTARWLFWRHIHACC